MLSWRGTASLDVTAKGHSTSDDEDGRTVPCLVVSRTTIIVARYGVCIQSCMFDFQSMIKDILLTYGDRFSATRRLTRRSYVIQYLGCMEGTILHCTTLLYIARSRSVVYSMS